MAVFKRRETPPPPELRLDVINGGVSYKYIESQLSDNQSPYMLNMNADDRGALTKRKGQKYVYETSLGASPINGLFYYKNKKIIAHGTKLYTQTDGQPIEIHSDLADSKGVFFIFNDKLYYLNGTNYIQYDGVTVQDVEGYVPQLTINRTPTGGGELLEEFNLLSSGFIDSFNGDGTSKDYLLSLKGLDSTEVVASTDGGITWNKVEGTDFSVNRTTGVVTWVSAPAEGTNNVLIKAFKTITELKERIKGCRYFELYGGENDTRVFVSGNPDYPNWYWYCSVFDPTYWPENSFNKVGFDSEAITGFIKQYDTLIVFKERSIYSVNYELKDDGTVSFPTKPLNSYVGCDMPYTIQLINNEPVFANTYKGVHILRSSQIRDERNVQLISSNINGSASRPGILDEPNLKQATSVDFDKKYWLCIGSKVWVWDYEQTPYLGNDEQLAWFPYDNINANCWLEVDRELYCGDSKGQLVTFEQSYRDFGEKITAVWRSKLFDFNLPDYLKTITNIWVKSRSDTYTKFSIRYITDNRDTYETQPEVVAKFSWAKFAWDLFSWQVTNFSKTSKRKPKLKNIVHFQIEFSNDEAGQNMSILSLIIQYKVNRKVK